MGNRHARRLRNPGIPASGIAASEIVAGMAAFVVQLCRMPPVAGVDDQAQLHELLALVRSLRMRIAGQSLLTVKSVNARHFLSKGALERLQLVIRQSEAQVCVLSLEISAAQQRNLQQILGVRLLDRTEVILNIFARRARSREGKLQVERAILRQSRSRLVRIWPHLERQRGGHGFLAGAGERQIDLDRRLSKERLRKIDKQLTALVRRRDQQRQKRKQGVPVIALAGYTNAGKSALFNSLLGREAVSSRDLLFETLDPTTRRLYLPLSGTVLLTDTVGFISNMPRELTQAFHATLIEILDAHLVLLVSDMSQPDAPGRRQEVLRTLDSLAVYYQRPVPPVLEVSNKCDLVTRNGDDITGCVVSAKYRYGLGKLKQAIANCLRQQASRPSGLIPAGTATDGQVTASGI